MDINKLVKKIENRIPSILGRKMFSKYAVLLPLIEKEDEIHVLFEVRSSQLRRQPGEICFPGGRIDQSDRDEKFTAIRETMEELGIEEDDIQNVSPLDYFVSPFHNIIYPHVGVISNPHKINPNPAEVGEVFTVPLSFFKTNPPEVYKIKFKVEPEENFPYCDIIGGEKYQWQVRGMDESFYYYEDRVIWGLTAGILKHFLEVLEEE
ncbi:NUDIX hydrolase [Ferdinandcohnia quinoae]|uniref:CoA pyrophosphatase n=1 Tax=Fredinandcohnia quinoae TaxID=2918902 RepID=A0AAW5ECD0_9BACI|nr:CoA pyrophosphatase [Fredinandcohnia sp. SECRCQ15]MCH1626823.1 CoA pyrophosphatase [Fredinandcohnia sp. SECRCQ15]